MESFSLRVSTLKEDPPLQASKWLKCQILVDEKEMANLFEHLGDFCIYLTGSVTELNSGYVNKTAFLEKYTEYIDALRAGTTPNAETFRSIFSSIFSLDKDSLYAVLVGNDRQLVRICKPVIQLQTHHMDYSTADGKFRSMIFGSESISWGIQFSYPQIFQDTKTLQVHNIDSSEKFPNTQLYKKLQRWVRNNTIPTPFLVGEQKINSPVRLGHNCLKWINRHPSLIKKGLQIRTANGT